MTTILSNEALFWKKKEFISFILSIMVFFIHISTFDRYENTHSLISIINERVSFFFMESITRFAVPMFFILSGISFFHDYDNSKYIKKIKNRVFTLFIPYLIWNTLWMFFDYFCSYSFISKFFVGREIFEFNVRNILEGIFFYKFNLPFWFIFDLLIFTIVSPVIFAIIRNKYIGILSITTLTILSLFEINIPTSVFYSSNSIIFFLIGAIVGKHFFTYFTKKSNKRLKFISMLFLIMYVIFKNIFFISPYIEKPILDVIIFTLCAFALWNIVDIFIDKIKPKAIFSRSFAIYALHVNVSTIITKIFILIFPHNEWFAIPNFITTIILSLTFINCFCILFENFFPKLYSIIMGNRLKEKN